MRWLINATLSENVLHRMSLKTDNNNDENRTCGKLLVIKVDMKTENVKSY